MLFKREARCVSGVDPVIIIILILMISEEHSPSHFVLFSLLTVVFWFVTHVWPLVLSIGAPSLAPAVFAIIDFLAPPFTVMLFAVGCCSQKQKEEPPSRCCNCLRTSDEMTSQDYTTNACTHCKSRCDWSEAEEWEEPPAEVLRAAECRQFGGPCEDRRA